jgi:hypothetical protein
LIVATSLGQAGVALSLYLFASHKKQNQRRVILQPHGAARFPNALAAKYFGSYSEYQPSGQQQHAQWHQILAVIVSRRRLSGASVGVA